MDSAHDTTRERATPAFLRGGGRLGEYIRAVDWASTPLGPPDTWPLPARTAARILLTTNHPVFLFLGPKLICLYNDAYCRSLGPEKHPAILGQPAEQVWAEIWDIIGPQINFVMTGQGSTWHENDLVPITRHGKREEVYWTYSFSPIDDATAPHGVGGVLVLCTETTAQVQNNERMRAAEQRWRRLFDQAPGFMCVLQGPEHRYEFANPMYFQLIDNDASILGKRVVEVLPWTVDQGFITLLDRVYQTGEPFLAHAAPMRLPSEDDCDFIRYVDFVYQPIRDEHGAISGILVLGQEVSEREHAQEALRQSDAQLRLACDAAQLGIHDYDIASGEIRWDERVRVLWGVGKDDAITIETFEAGLHPDDRIATREQLLHAMNPDGSRHFHAEYRVVHHGDGRIRWIQATGRVAFDGRRAVRLVGTVADITERKEADSRRLEFLATLGHELRNPLAPISSSLFLLQRQQNLTETEHRAHAVIDRQLKHMVRLLEDLLDLVRISNGRIELRKSDVDLRDMVQMALETAAPHIERGQHRVNLQLPKERVTVYADAVRLAQVFSNLLINACKYSDAETEIGIAVDVTEGIAHVRVTDQGVGISAVDLTRVFDMFSQIALSLDRSEGGLGIGLSLAKRLVEMHGGNIEARSAGKQQGSQFIVHLPATLASLSDPASPADAEPTTPMSGRRILVVDDNQDAALSLAALLEYDGAHVSLAHTGTDAIQIAETFQPSVVVLDIGLPGLNGYDVCRELRATPRGPQMRIIALTGWGQATDRALSAEAGFDAHLVKPVDYEALMRVVLVGA